LFYFQGPVTFKVAVPNMSEKTEFKLRGQMLNITLGIQETVTAIKARLHEETGMAPGKQKLHWEVCYVYTYYSCYFSIEIFFNFKLQWIKNTLCIQN
jgi:hypothetical protein